MCPGPSARPVMNQGTRNKGFQIMVQRAITLGVRFLYLLSLIPSPPRPRCHFLLHFQRRRLRNVEIAPPESLGFWSLCGPETALLRVEHRAEVEITLHLIHHEILGKLLRSHQRAKATSVNQRPVPCALLPQRHRSEALALS